MSDAITRHAPADVRELAGEIIRSLDLIARNYDSYEYGLPVMTHYDEMVDTVVAALRTPRGEAGGDSTDCPTCGDELAVYWEEGRIQGVVSLDEPARAALLRAPRGEGKAVRLLGLAMERAELLCQDAGRAEWPLSDFGRDMLQARLDTVRDLIGDALAALRTPAAPTPGWSEVKERANMLRAVLREHGFEHLRNALVGQHSDAVCYGQWERHKALLRDLLDALDAALSSEPPGATNGEGEADAESGGDVTVSQLLAVLDEYNAGVFCMTPENADGTPMFSVAVARGESAERLKQWAREDAEEPAALRSEAQEKGGE